MLASQTNPFIIRSPSLRLFSTSSAYNIDFGNIFFLRGTWTIHRKLMVYLKGDTHINRKLYISCRKYNLVNGSIYNELLGYGDLVHEPNYAEVSFSLTAAKYKVK